MIEAEKTANKKNAMVEFNITYSNITKNSARLYIQMAMGNYWDISQKVSQASGAPAVPAPIHPISKDHPSNTAYVENGHLSKSDRIARRKFCLRDVVVLALGFCLHRVVII